MKRSLAAKMLDCILGYTLKNAVITLKNKRKAPTTLKFIEFPEITLKLVFNRQFFQISMDVRPKIINLRN